MNHIGRVLVAGALALTLAACSEEEAAEAPAPPNGTVEENRTADERAERDRAVAQLREGAESIAEGAGKLLQQGRDAAERALEDAGPALRQAEQTTRELGRIALGAAEEAAEDLRRAAEQLNRRIEDSPNDVTVPEGDPQARLPAPELLSADTLAAARARPAGVGPDYVGVWAAQAEQCARIDQEAVEQMAVITPTTLRRYESVCNIESAPLTDGSATLAAGCIVEGETEQRSIALTMSSPDRLTIGPAQGVGEATLVRCHLPG